MESVLEQGDSAVRRTHDKDNEEKTAIWPEYPAIQKEQTDGAEATWMEEQPRETNIKPWDHVAQQNKDNFSKATLVLESNILGSSVPDTDD